MDRYAIQLGKKLSEQALVVYDIKKFRSECLRHANPWTGFKEAKIRFLDVPWQPPYQHWVNQQQGEFVITENTTVLLERLRLYRQMMTLDTAVAGEIDRIAEVTV